HSLRRVLPRRIDRRTFLRRSAAVTAGGLLMAQALMPRYAQAQTISFTDERIQARYVTYPSPGGNSGTMRGYLVQPKGNGPFPAVLVIHENRGLNPYIEDVARRCAIEGFLALAPDGLFPAGGPQPHPTMARRHSRRPCRTSRPPCRSTMPRPTTPSTACGRLTRRPSRPTARRTRCTPIPARGTAFITIRRRATTRRRRRSP